MPSDENLQYIELSDFSQGISQGYHSLSNDETLPDGFAQDDETYGCFALPQGGLGPLPRITFSREGGDPNTGEPNQKWPTVADGYPANYDQRIAILDAMIQSPVIYSPPLTDPNDIDFPSVDLFTVRQWYMVTTDDTKVDMFYRFRAHPIYSGVTTGAFANKDIHALAADASWNPDPSRWLYGWGGICMTRTQPYTEDFQPSVYDTGPPVVVAGMGGMIELGGVNDGDPEGVELAGYFSWPDVHETNGTPPIAKVQDRTWPLNPVFGAALPGMVFGHQGRVMAIGRQSAYKYGRLLAYHGDEDGVAATTELVYYWPVNDIYNSDVRVATAAEEHTSGYGSWHSVNANSLLLIKNTGGAVLINGDVNGPQVTRLPGVPSIGGLANRGTVTDKGYAYGSSSGVWMWGGSDTAVCLSPNLDPDFWLPDDPTISRRQLGQLNGSFGFRYPFIFAPNNWCCDLRTGGWFRYHPTPTQDPVNGLIFAFNEVDYQGRLWAVTASYKLDTIFYVMFDTDTPVSYYTWKSQPIVKTSSRVLKFRELQLVASGEGRVTITITGLDENPPQTETFDLTSNKISTFTKGIGVQAKDVTIKIESEAANPANPAPNVLRVSLGYLPNQQMNDRRGR